MTLFNKFKGYEVATSLNSVSQHIANGVEENIKYELKKTLMERAESIIDSLVRDYTKQLTMNMSSYCDYESDKIKVIININRIKQE